MKSICDAETINHERTTIKKIELLKLPITERYKRFLKYWFRCILLIKIFFNTRNTFDLYFMNNDMEFFY